MKFGAGIVAYNRQLQDITVLRLVQLSLAEDIGDGDITSEATIAESVNGSAELLAKTDTVVCGAPVAEIVLAEVDRALTVEWAASESELVRSGKPIGVIRGPLRTMLAAERTLLNFIQRMSGVATLTRRYVDAVQGTGARVTDTRKTIPGWRLLDKYAVSIGGGVNHRLGLFDMAMIKDNHIEAAGSIHAAMERMLAARTPWKGQLPRIEVEAANLDQVAEILACRGVDRIMFDNFSIADLRRGVNLVGGAIETEASGGITLGTIRDVAQTGVNYISVGALTHSATAVDIALNVKRVRSA